jgi:uncharacterized protein (TIGR03083 family)
MEERFMMFDLTSATKAAEDDLGAIIDLLAGLTDDRWDAPVRCVGWRVSDLAAHVTGAGRGQAEGLRRAAAGITDLAVLDPPAARDPRSLVAALKESRDKLMAALYDVQPSVLAGTVPLPFGLLPTQVALQVVALEYGFHRNDLGWALGHEVPLAEDMSATLLAILPGLLPMLAGGSPVSAAGIAPANPVSFRLIAPSGRLLVAHAEDGWSMAPDPGDAPVSCEVHGDDSSVALFVMGRIGADHLGLTVTDQAAARAFKQYFPGP